jgi:hypothetical protein
MNTMKSANDVQAIVPTCYCKQNFPKYKKWKYETQFTGRISSEVQNFSDISV